MKKFGLVLALLILVLPINAYPTDEWDNIDKTLLVTAESFLFIDYLQTNYIFNSPEYTETNLIIESLGERSVPIYFATWMIVTPIIAHY